MRRCAGVHCLLLIAAALLPAGVASADPEARHGNAEPIVEYAFIDANEGGAAGGHVALRIDDVVHHFHLEPGGVLRLYREDVARFEHLYTRRRNRTIQSARLDVTPETRDLLRAGFDGYFAEQEAAAARFSAAREDAAWLARLAAIAGTNPGEPPPSPREDAGLPLEGLGFFYADGAAPLVSALPGDPAARAIREVAARVADRAGPDAIDARTHRLRDEIRALDSESHEAALTAERIHAQSFARRHGDRLVALAALDVLRRAPAPRTDALRESNDPALVLSAEDRSALEAERAFLIDRSARAALSDDAAQGFALIVALARLAAIDVSLARNQLVVLDAFAPHHDVVRHTDLAARQEEVAELRAATRAGFAAARAELRASITRESHGAGSARDEPRRDEPRRDDPGRAEPGGDAPRRDELHRAVSNDTAFERLESAVNRWLEAEEAFAGRRDLRVNTGPLVPSRIALRSDVLLPARSPDALRADAARIRVQADTDARHFRTDYEYALLTRNCVTEIFRIIDASLIGSTSRFLDAQERTRAEAASRERLGGFIDAGGGLHLIPHRAYAAVLATWHIASTREIPSWRRQQLTAMERSGEGTLGERSVFTSSIYQPNDEDSLFLFFTDDAFVARPLYGLANLMVGFGGALAGLVSAPFDGGRMLDRAGRGIVFSLPELAFSNIRKGSFEGTSTDEAAGGAVADEGERDVPLRDPTQEAP